MRLRDPSIVTAELLDGLASNLPARLLIEFRWSPKKRSLTHPADERSNSAVVWLRRGATIAVIETLGNLGAVYLAFKAADLVFTYFVIRFIWRRRKWRPLSFRKG